MQAAAVQQCDLVDPAFARLSALARPHDSRLSPLESGLARPQRIAARAELFSEGDPIPQPILLLSGWAARVRRLADGRRQILGLLLPGDLIGIARRHDPVAISNIVALTDLAICPAPCQDDLEDVGLSKAYDRSRSLEEHYLLAQIVRLGRLSAYERIADLLLELWERLKLAGLATTSRFPVPLTQDLLADTLGLTNVHVNRTLQALRREGVLTLEAGMATLHDTAALADQVHHRAPPLKSAHAD